jgi:NhaP-type Na+/H+ and K+/H+ antiporter
MNLTYFVVVVAVVVDGQEKKRTESKQKLIVKNRK